jgi:hypothetical protein
MVTPFHTPTRVKRRRTPSNCASASRMLMSGMPSSFATAMAASEFCTLCSPGIGNVRPASVR